MTSSSVRASPAVVENWKLNLAFLRYAGSRVTTPLDRNPWAIPSEFRVLYGK